MAAGALWVFAQDDGSGGTDIGPRVPCSTPPKPTLTLSSSVRDYKGYLTATTTTPSHPYHTVGVSFRWTDNNSTSKSRTVTEAGTHSFTGKAQSVAERTGNICESAWVKKSISVTVPERPICPHGGIHPNCNPEPCEHGGTPPDNCNPEPCEHGGTPPDNCNPEPCENGGTPPDCNTECGGDAGTRCGPLPPPTDTPTPTLTPTPVPDLVPVLPDNIGPYSRQGSGSISAVLPEATGGDQPLTYSKPSSSGASSVYFNSNTRRVTVSISTAPKTATIVYRVTDDDGDFDSQTITFRTTAPPPPTPTSVPTAVTPPLAPTFTGFTVWYGSTALQHSDSANWAVLHQSDDVQLAVSAVRGTTFSDYEFKLDMNSGLTGFYIPTADEGCLGTTLEETTGWVQLLSNGRYDFEMIRCRLGDPSNAGFDLEVRRMGETPTTALGSTPSIPLGIHRADAEVTYTAEVNTQLLGELGPGKPNPLKALLTLETTRSANRWSQAGGAQFSPSSSQPDVTIKVYTTDGGGTDHCPGSKGCIWNVADPTESHLGTQNIYLRYEPNGPGSEWTNILSRAERRFNVYGYLPYTLTHEMGHAAGVGHLPYKAGFMGDYGKSSIGQNGLSLEDIYGIQAVASPHSHSQ